MTAVAHASPAELRRLAAVSYGRPCKTRWGRRPDVWSVGGPMRSPIDQTSARAAPHRPAASSAAVYRRRRVAAVVVVVSAAAAVLLAVHALLAAFGGGPLTASERPGGAGGVVYVVQPGDTFWDIARRLEPNDDPRPLVAQLVAAHGSPVLVAGERLRLPPAS